MVISEKRGVGAVRLPEPRAPSVSPSAAEVRRPVDTKVSLSQAARQSPQALPRAQSDMSRAAHANASDAETFAYDTAYVPDTIGIDASEWVHGGPLRIQATGEVLTPEFEAEFKVKAHQVQQARIHLYESEKAKGTPAADIFDMLEAQFAELPADYRALVRSNATK
jgi:hypothetical protein